MTTSKALKRVWDGNELLVTGRLTADGRNGVYTLGRRLDAVDAILERTTSQVIPILPIETMLRRAALFDGGRADKGGAREQTLSDPGDVRRDCSSDACPEMVVLPPGTFTMGSPETE